MNKMFVDQARDPTIVPLKQGKCQLGQKEGFSDTDIRKLNTFYQVIKMFDDFMKLKGSVYEKKKQGIGLC